MKSTMLQVYVFVLVIFISCDSKTATKGPSPEPVVKNASASANDEQAGGIVGEWEQLGKIIVILISRWGIK